MPIDSKIWIDDEVTASPSKPPAPISKEEAAKQLAELEKEKERLK